MGAFASSFEKAFVPAAKSSSDATADLIKQSIAKQEAKALEEAKNLKAQQDYDNLRTFISKKNPQLANDLGQLDVTDMSSDTLTTINKIMAKQVAPELAATGTPVKGFVVDASNATATPVINPETGKPEFAPGTRLLQAPMSAQTVGERARAGKEAVAEVELATKPTIAAEVEKAKQEVKLDYPNLDEKGKSAAAAYKFVSPRVEKLNTLIDAGLFKDATLVKQIVMNKSGDLIVPNGSPLEEAIGLINDIKLTGFNIAGAAFTGTEKQVAFTLLDPTGKSDDRYKRDIASFLDLFGTRVEAGVGGLREAKKIAAEVKSKREGQPQYEYRTVNGKTQRRLISGK